ncbi:MAG: DMT family transporter [Patescibacteria group bacterium]
MHILGIILALTALICWGIGDFLIQRTSRDYGIWTSTFCITVLGAIVLFPFAQQDFPVLFQTKNALFLLGVAVVTCIGGLLVFESLKQGKIAAVEPVLSFELPLTVLLGVVVLGEELLPLQMILIIFVFGGILLLGYTGRLQSKHFLEKGILIALLATIMMACVNFTTGLASRAVGPIATIWFVHSFVGIVCIIRLFVTRSWRHLVKDISLHPIESFFVAVLDNGAWLAYAAAVIIIPISLTVAITESYIILAILLGVIINKERLLRHQWVGVIVTLAAILVLSYIS